MRDVFLGLHVTEETKESLRFEAARRNRSMSDYASAILERQLKFDEQEEIATKPRSNKRRPISTEEDVPLPLEKD